MKVFITVVFLNKKTADEVFIKEIVQGSHFILLFPPKHHAWFPILPVQVKYGNDKSTATKNENRCSNSVFQCLTKMKVRIPFFNEGGKRKTENENGSSNSRFPMSHKKGKRKLKFEFRFPMSQENGWHKGKRIVKPPIFKVHKMMRRQGNLNFMCFKRILHERHSQPSSVTRLRKPWVKMIQMSYHRQNMITLFHCKIVVVHFTTGLYFKFVRHLH